MSEKPINVLVVFANPIGTAALRLGAEDRAIKEALYHGSLRDKIRVEVLHAANIHDVRDQLLRSEYQIIQFSGHSDAAGFLFEDQDGHRQSIGFEALALFLRAYSPPIQCVILNACSTLEQGKFIAFDVPFVVAMRAPIEDRLATEFSRGFYDAIAAGKSIEFAFEEGRRCVLLVSQLQADLPVLVKHTITGGLDIDKYDRWYQQLSSGKLETTLDPSTTNELNVLISIVEKVLKEKGFDKDVIDRTAVIIWELVLNVARYVPLSPATFGIEVNASYLPIVKISVADRGRGFAIDEVLEDEYLKMRLGEPEHGLGRVRRLSDEVDQQFPYESNPFHTVLSTVYGLSPLKSVFDDFPWCARVITVHEGPYYVWFGNVRQTHGACLNALHLACEQDIPQLLDTYLGHLLLSDPQYLGIEVRGRRDITERAPFAFDVIVEALETYFAEFFRTKRVILFANGGSKARDLKRLCEKHGLEFFISEDACRQKLRTIEEELLKKNRAR